MIFLSNTAKKINIEFGYKIKGNIISWIFWLDDDALPYSVIRLDVNKKEKEVIFIEGRFDPLLRWRGTEAMFKVLKIDWYFKSLAKPQKLLTFELFEAMVCSKITNPIVLADKILIKHGAKGLVSPKMFYRHVLSNENIEIDEQLDSIFMLIKVANKPYKAIENIANLLNRLRINEDFFQLLNYADQMEEKIDVFWSDKRVENELDYYESLFIDYDDNDPSDYSEVEYFASKVKKSGVTKTIQLKYIGNPMLPKFCHFICDSRSLHKEGISMNHCIASYWHSLLHRKSFILHMERPQKVTFEIKRNGSGWFYVHDASSENNGSVSEMAILIVKTWISKMHAQLFLFKNSCFNKDSYGRRYHFLGDPTLHDEVFEPETFKYKVINSILT